MFVTSGATEVADEMPIVIDKSGITGATGVPDDKPTITITTNSSNLSAVLLPPSNCSAASACTMASLFGEDFLDVFRRLVAGGAVSEADKRFCADVGALAIEHNGRELRLATAGAEEELSPKALDDESGMSSIRGVCFTSQPLPYNAGSTQGDELVSRVFGGEGIDGIDSLCASPAPLEEERLFDEEPPKVVYEEEAEESHQGNYGNYYGNNYGYGNNNYGNSYGNGYGSYGNNQYNNYDGGYYDQYGNWVYGQQQQQ